MLRRGTSLAEVLVALTIGAIVLASALGSLLRQQRNTAHLAAAGQGRSQLLSATALLPAQLGLSSPAVADLTPGEARDTSLQLRLPVATGVSCDGGMLVAIDADDDTRTPTGAMNLPRAGDSLWWYRSDSARWDGRLVLDAWSDSLPCSALGTGGDRRLLRVRVDGTDPVAPVAPVRVTRQTRLSIYRSGDGTWQLGLREWSDVTHSLSPPQPVAGPFQRIGADGTRTGFRYFDSLGLELFPATQPGQRAGVTRIRFTGLLSPPAGAASLDAPSPRDSADVVVRPGGE